MGNSQVKLIFPSHGLPFVIPYSEVPVLESKIEKILVDMEEKDPSIKNSGKLRLPNGTVLDPPSPGDWVLVDTLNATIIHRSFLGALVYGGYTYMILPMRASTPSPENLKEAIKVVNSTREGAGVCNRYKE